MSPTVWAVDPATPTAYNTFSMFAAFHGTQPSYTTFNIDDIMTQTDAASTNARYSIDGSQTGVAIPIGGARSMWLMLQMPPQTSTIQPQKMIVTVTAGTP
jgi:hypothetical protein